MNIIEQLEALPRWWALIDGKSKLVLDAYAVGAIIEQEKREAVEPVAYTDSDNNYLEWTIEALCEKAVCSKNDAIPLYTAPQPDHTKLIWELVEALKKAEKCLVNSCVSHRNKVYPKPVDRVRVANHCNRVITKAREAIK